MIAHIVPGHYVKASSQRWLSRMLLGARPLDCAGLDPAVAGCADPIDTVCSAAPTGAEAPDGLSSPEAAATGPLASPTRQSRRL